MRKLYRVCMLVALLAWAIGPANAQSGNFNWQGFYIGAHGNQFSASTDYANADTPSQQFGGAMLGLQAGYNWQFGRLVVGAEADIAFGSLNDFIRDGNFLTPRMVRSARSERCGRVSATASAIFSPT